MSKRLFKAQASSSRIDPTTGSGAFGTVFAGSTLSYLSEPPNLSSITDANVAVTFKNLLKKDGMTKAKGLEDLRSFVHSHPYEKDGGVEEPILEAWVKLYPRLSIDNSRRVRELSHILQYELLKSARRRMEKHIPIIVGAWLSGTYDRDRPVARAANDGITSFLDTEEKIIIFWRRCQRQVLAYAQEAFQETPQTLSDERGMNSDDLQAKYDRVIGASISLVVNLLIKLDDNSIQKHQEAYETFLSGNKTLWNFITSNDSFLRRATAQLLSVCLDKQSIIIERDLDLISYSFISEGLRTTQTGSSLQFLQALLKVTQKFPTVWSTAYKGKKSALARLLHFIEKGSQGGSSEYWLALTALFKIIPVGVLPTCLDGAMDLLRAQRSGICSREEARTNAPAAWASYFDVVHYLGAKLSDTNDSEKLLRATVFPAFEQFLRPAPEQSSWSIGNNTLVLAKAFRICSISEHDRFPKFLEEEWWRLAEVLSADMLISLPEQSKDYAKSQATVVGEAHRWFTLHADIIRSAELVDSPSVDQTIEVLAGPCSSMILKALRTISTRNGKVYGAASVLDSALRITPRLVIAVHNTQAAVESFLKDEVPSLLTSPSSNYLISSMFAFGFLPDQKESFKEIWKSAVHGILDSPDNLPKTKAIHGLISNHSINQMAQENAHLQKYLLEYVSKVMHAQMDEWDLFESAITFDILSTETAGTVMSIIRNSIGSGDSSLRALEYIVRKKPQLLRVKDETYLAVMTELLLLTEAQDTATVSRATALKYIIETAGAATLGSNQASSQILEIVKENLETIGPQSLTIDTLVQQARKILQSQKDVSLMQVLPNAVQWSEALLPIIEKMPNSDLSLTNSLGSAVLLIQSPYREKTSQPVRHIDSNGFTIAFRMAMYTSKLMCDRLLLKDLPKADMIMILRLLSLTFALADDQCNLREENRLWDSLADVETEGQVFEFMDSEHTIFGALCKEASSWRDEAPESPSALLAQGLVKNLIEASSGDSPVAFYSARALNRIISTLITTHGWNSPGSEEWLASLDVLKTSTQNVFAAVAILSGIQEFLATSKLINNLCNRLISDVIGASANDERTLDLFVLLNATLAVYEPSNLAVAQNRILFAVKHITLWMSEDHTLAMPLAAEACRSLQLLLPSMKDVYGPYWKTSIEFCVSLWKDKHHKRKSGGQLDQLPVLNSSLRLVSSLRNFKDPNEDLSEALTDLARSISDGLLELLKVPRIIDSSPWLVFQNHLWRQTADIPINHIPDLSILYPLVASDSFLVQSAAFLMLSRAIPVAQEQISLDVVLEKKDARLPEELLSLLLNAPSSENFSDEQLEKFPTQIRSFLYSWELIFASYPKASYKVRNDYNEALRSENCITPLFDFLFDILGHSTGQPLNLDKANISSEDIQAYDELSAQCNGGERNIQWLLVNLYYLCLKFAPSLAKNWWMNCKSKQTRIAVESWTEKYFSPLVIADSLDEVTTWAGQQEAGSEDEKELIIKASKNSREVFAGCEIDDMQMQIVIRLPTTYPLEGVKVDGVNRVAVSEKKWQSWLIITQGVITFSNGSIVDGLTTFRRNITGALKGQTECAICYSIISSDKKMPDKRCQTCKNTFHSSCLFKWFASSNQSTCPLCRNPFNYGNDVADRARRRGGPENI